MKKALFFIVGLFAIIVVVSGCKKEEPTPPPSLQILKTDTTGKMGELKVEVYYIHGYNNEKISSAPQLTNVQLFASYDDIKDGGPIYRTWTWDSNIIYFGFLNPEPLYQYYVLASATIDGVKYQRLERAMINAGQITIKQVYMEPLPTNQ